MQNYEKVMMNRKERKCNFCRNHGIDATYNTVHRKICQFNKSWSCEFGFHCKVCQAKKVPSPNQTIQNTNKNTVKLFRPYLDNEKEQDSKNDATKTTTQASVVQIFNIMWENFLIKKDINNISSFGKAAVFWLFNDIRCKRQSVDEFKVEFENLMEAINETSKKLTPSQSSLPHLTLAQWTTQPIATSSSTMAESGLQIKPSDLKE